MPTSLAAQEIDILNAVWDHDSNFCAFRCSGAVTIDWGDGGATENVASGVTAVHNYTYASVGSLTTRGYRQALIKITPQAANNITSFSVQFKHTTDTNTSTSASYGMLDIKMQCPNLTTLAVGGTTTTNLQMPRMLEQFEMVGTSAMTSASGTFRNCIGLQRVKLYTGLITGSMSSCFNNCRMLRVVEGLDGATPTSVASIFTTCYALKKSPALIPTAAADSAFTDCHSLTDISAFVFASITSSNAMLSNCRSLVTVGNIIAPLSADPQLFFSGCVMLETVGNVDFRASTFGSSIFSGCSKLRTVGTVDLRLATNFASIFANCLLLTTVGTITSTAATSLASAFLGCTALLTAPTFSSTSSVTNFSSMFSGCSNLQIVPIYTVGAANLTSMFLDCWALAAAPAFNYSTITTGTTLFSGCRNLSKGILANAPPVSHSYLNCKLSAAALDVIYTALPTIVAQTITVTGNYGTATDTPALCTGRGWTVTA